MLPPGYLGLIVADTRRATEWEAGLTAAGFDPARVETRGDDADKGGWQVGVPRRYERDARRFVSEVLSGERTLPRRLAVSNRALLSLGAIVVILIALFAAAAIAR